MKKFTYILALCAALALVAGCASNDVRNIQYYQIVRNNEQKAEDLAKPEQTEATAAVEEPLSEESALLPTESAEPAANEAAPESAEQTEFAQEEVPAEQTQAAQEEAPTEQQSDAQPAPEELDDYYSEKYAAYKLSDEERAFTKDSIFVGDSICRGFSEYKVVSRSNVFARGSLAARNFFDFVQYYGDDEVDFLTVLRRTQPKFIFFSMGMNDVNMTDEEQYCENYKALIDMALENSDAEVFVAAITPVCSEFTSNYRIDCFNLRMEKFLSETYPQRVHYYDFAKHLKDSDGNLRECFDGGDGVHLAPYAYYVALWEMNRVLTACGLT